MVRQRSLCLNYHEDSSQGPLANFFEAFSLALTLARYDHEPKNNKEDGDDENEIEVLSEHFEDVVIRHDEFIKYIDSIREMKENERRPMKLETGEMQLLTQIQTENIVEEDPGKIFRHFINWPLFNAV